MIAESILSPLVDKSYGPGSGSSFKMK
jgi:hypothetical protein